MARTRAKLKPSAQAIFDIMSACAVESDSAHIHGTLAECAATIAKLYGAPLEIKWAKLELRVVCRPWLKDPAHRDRRDVYLFEIDATVGARNSLLHHVDAAVAQWLHLIEFAKAIGAKVNAEPIGANLPTFVHPDWAEPK